MQPGDRVWCIYMEDESSKEEVNYLFYADRGELIAFDEEREGYGTIKAPVVGEVNGLLLPLESAAKMSDLGVLRRRMRIHAEQSLPEAPEGHIWRMIPADPFQERGFCLGLSVFLQPVNWGAAKFQLGQEVWRVDYLPYSEPWHRRDFRIYYGKVTSLDDYSTDHRQYTLDCPALRDTSYADAQHPEAELFSSRREAVKSILEQIQQRSRELDGEELRLNRERKALASIYAQWRNELD